MKMLMGLTTNHPDPVIAPSAWRWRAYKTSLCPECHRIRRSDYPRPCDVVLTNHPGYRIEGGVCDTGINIFHLGFIEQIREHLSGYVFGKCFDAQGKLIEEYVTCYSKHYVIQRGNNKSRYWICKTCGAISPSGWHGLQYVLRCCLTDLRVYQDASCCMFLDEELACQLDLSPWPDAELEPIAIRDEPMDGQHFPSDPPVLVRQ